MIPPLNELYKRAMLEWNHGEKSVRLLKWAEGLSAVVASAILTGYLSSGKIDPRLEGELKACASPTFGMYVAILRLGSTFLASTTSASFLPFLEYENPQVSTCKLREAAALLAKKFSLSFDPSRVTAVSLLDLLLGVRNRGIGHGGLPTEEEANSLSTICHSLMEISNRFFRPQLLLTTSIHADTRATGHFVVRGVMYTGESERLWEESSSDDDLLQLKRVYFIDRDGNPRPAPPFLQIDSGQFWFLQKYRRSGNSPFTDLRGTQTKSDTYWDSHLKGFFEERFERGGKHPVQVSDAGVYHNLPPEDEAYKKFVGRRDAIEQLQAYISPNKRTHIVVLSGVGGVGKTALARAFVQATTEASESARDFDYIVWASAKTTILKETVEQLQPEFEDIEDVLDEIARVCDSPELVYQRPFDRKKAELLSLLGTGRFLLVIDNFETIKRKEKFWEFLLDIPTPSKILVTSRETFAEGCLILQVTELQEMDALEVFQHECEALELNPHLILKSTKERAELVSKTGGIPLALKHIAILIHRGSSLEEALKRLSASSGPIADFCFKETFKVLEKEFKSVWLAFGILQRPAAVGELVQLTTLPEYQVVNILTTLKKYSIVIRSVDTDGFEIFSCLPLTLEFARKEIQSWPGAGEMTHRYREYRSIMATAGIKEPGSEAGRFIRAASVLHPKLLPRELARKALVVFREGRTEDALKLLDSAQNIDSNQPSIYDARAQIAMGEFEYQAAYDSYAKLVALTPANISALRELTNLCKILEDWDAAIDYGRKVINLPGATKKDHHILGMMYYRRAKVEKDKNNQNGKEASLLSAIDCFKSAFISNPKSFSDRNHNKYACHSLALTYMHLRRIRDAEEALAQGLAYAPYDRTLLDLQKSLYDRQNPGDVFQR